MSANTQHSQSFAQTATVNAEAAVQQLLTNPAQFAHSLP
jgi:hypothetical protein